MSRGKCDRHNFVTLSPLLSQTRVGSRFRRKRAESARSIDTPFRNTRCDGMGCIEDHPTSPHFCLRTVVISFHHLIDLLVPSFVTVALAASAHTFNPSPTRKLHHSTRTHNTLESSSTMAQQTPATPAPAAALPAHMQAASIARTPSPILSPMHDPKHKAVVQPPVAPLGAANRMSSFGLPIQKAFQLIPLSFSSQPHHSRPIDRPITGHGVCPPWSRTKGTTGQEVCKGKVSQAIPHTSTHLY